MADQIKSLSEADLEFLHQLLNHPKLYARLRSLLDLADSGGRTVVSADQLESELVELMRQLGRTTMESWAALAEETVVGELRRDQPAARLKKKRLSNGIACGDRSP